MDNFDRELDELLKDALNSDNDVEGLTMDEDLIASTLSAIKEAAPYREEIRASFDEGFTVNETEEEEPVVAVGQAEKAEPPRQTDNVVSLQQSQQARERKKGFFTGKNIAAICGVVAGLAAVVLSVMFFNSTLFGSKESMSSFDTSAPMSAASTESAMEKNGLKADYAETKTMDGSELEMSTADAPTSYAVENSTPMAAFEATKPAEDGLYYFDDDDYVDKNSSTNELLNDVFMVNDKNVYKPLLDEIRNASVSDPVVNDRESDETVGSSGNTLAVTAGEVKESAEAEAEEDVSDEAAEEEFDFNDPEQLAEALNESKQMLEETGGLPSEAAGEVIGSVEVGGELVPDFDYSPEKNPYWTELEDSSDEAFSEFAPLITIYDRDVDADLDVCIRVYDDKCIIDDYATDISTTYSITDGKALADKLRSIIP